MARAIVAIEVDAGEARIIFPAIDVSAGNRAIARIVAVFQNRRAKAFGRRLRRAGGEPGLPGSSTERPLHDLPTVVLSSAARTGLKVDLLANALSDVSDVKVSGLAVEGEPPRVAQALGPDFPARRRGCRERIRRRDSVERRTSGVRVDIQAKDLPEQDVVSLRAAVWALRRAAVSDSGIQVPIGSELQLAAVMVGIGRIRNRQQHNAARRIGPVRLRARAPVTRDHQVPRPVRVGDEEQSVGGVVRVKGDGEQSAFPAAGDSARDVEKRGTQNARSLPDHDPSIGQREKEPGIAGGGDRRDRAQSGGQSLEPHVGDGPRGRGIRDCRRAGSGRGEKGAAAERHQDCAAKARENRDRFHPESSNPARAEVMPARKRNRAPRLRTRDGSDPHNVTHFLI